jgi:hypothetical protein
MDQQLSGNRLVGPCRDVDLFRPGISDTPNRPHDMFKKIFAGAAELV